MVRIFVPLIQQQTDNLKKNVIQQMRKKILESKGMKRTEMAEKHTSDTKFKVIDFTSTYGHDGVNGTQFALSL